MGASVWLFRLCSLGVSVSLLVLLHAWATAPEALALGSELSALEDFWVDGWKRAVLLRSVAVAPEHVDALPSPIGLSATSTACYRASALCP